MTINFPVLMSKKLPGTRILAQSVEVGTVVELKPEPENSFDKYAIAVYYDGVKLGYLPNRGVLCPHCWTSVKRTDVFCPGCNATNSDMAEGGLARRVLELGLLEKHHGCHIYEVKPDSDVMFMCTLVVVERGIND